MGTAAEFYRNMRDDLVRAIKSVTPFRATAEADATGKVSIVRLGNATADGESYARIDGFDVEAGADLVCFTVAGKPVCVPFVNGAPTSHTLSGALVVGSLNTPVVSTLAQSSSDNASTTSTASFSVAGDIELVLPTGTWTVKVIGGVSLQHSAGGNAQWTIGIAGNDGTVRTLSMSSTAWATAIDDGEISGLSGTINVSIKFRSNTAGTTSARNPWLLVIAQRTS